MLYHGLLQILNRYCDPIDSIQLRIEEYFRNKVSNYLKKESETGTSSKKRMILKFIENLSNLGFFEQDIHYFFSNFKIHLNSSHKKGLNLNLESEFKRLLKELIMMECVEYISGRDQEKLFTMLKKENLLSISVLVKLKNLKDLYDEYKDKKQNLKKYLSIRNKFFTVFEHIQNDIELLQKEENLPSTLQLLYLLLRILKMFNIEEQFNFESIKCYLRDNLEDYLQTVPLVTLKNPDIYFCGLFLAKLFEVEINEEVVHDFTKKVYKEIIDEFEAPLIGATRRIYYLVKSLDLLDKNLSESEKELLTKGDLKFFSKANLQKLETARLIIILKLLNILNLNIDASKKNDIIELIETRISQKITSQSNNTITTSEEEYYIIFYHFIHKSLDKLNGLNSMNEIVSKILRNLTLLKLDCETCNDIISELFYSFEGLKLLNCIGSKEILQEFQKFFFPDIFIKENHALIKEGWYNHEISLSVDSITGEIYDKQLLHK